MTDYRHAGVGWPNGPTNDAILDLPSDRLLLLSSEARWHHDRLVSERGKRVLWRHVPTQERRPARVGYDAESYIDGLLSLTDAARQPISGIVPWNELDLNYERGDDDGDFDDLPQRYARLGRFQERVIRLLDGSVRPDTDLHFGAWTPDHNATDYLQHWQVAASICDVVDFHAYRSLNEIQSQYRLYRSAFPDKRLALTEWHCYGDLDEERLVLQWLADQMAEDPLFEAAYFFIWRWDNPADWWATAFDIEHDHGRRVLFMDPPVFSERDRLERVARAAAIKAGVDPDTFVRQINQESGFNPQAHNDASGADGIAQIVVKWHPSMAGKTGDPDLSLAYAAELMGKHLAATGDMALALSYYNAGPAATDRGRNGEIDGWPYAETVTYVANILQIPQSEARRRLTGSPALSDGDLLYGPDVPDSVVRQLNDWSCAVRSTYAAAWAMHEAGHGPSVSYGTDAADDVYAWLVPAYADWNDGLKNRSGVGIVAALKTHGYSAGSQWPASIADVRARAGKQPVLIGGSSWGPAGHWVYVRGVEPDGTLILENPAGTYQGISDRIRDSFDKLGPWGMVWIDVPDLPPNAAELALIDALRLDISTLRASLAEVTSERDQALASRNSLIEGLAVAADHHGDAIQSALDAIKQIRAERVGVRPS